MRARKGIKVGDTYSPEVLDYAMSKEFGLDWVNYDFERMMTLNEIMNIVNSQTNQSQNGRSDFKRNNQASR